VNSEEFEFNFNTNLRGHWLPVFQGRIKKPLLRGLQTLRIPTVSESVDGPNISRMSAR